MRYLQVQGTTAQVGPRDFMIEKRKDFRFFLFPCQVIVNFLSCFSIAPILLKTEQIQITLLHPDKTHKKNSQSKILLDECFGRKLTWVFRHENKWLGIWAVVIRPCHCLSEKGNGGTLSFRPGVITVVPLTGHGGDLEAFNYVCYACVHTLTHSHRQSWNWNHLKWEFLWCI